MLVMLVIRVFITVFLRFNVWVTEYLLIKCLIFLVGENANAEQDFPHGKPCHLSLCCFADILREILRGFRLNDVDIADEL